MTYSFLKRKLNLFYLLALAPLFLILYSGYVARNMGTLIIPFYAFLLLYIKESKLSVFAEASLVFRVLGLIMILASFFVYYVVVRFYPSAQFYGAANYTAHIVGLFLVFFQAYALREAFTPVFLIVAATAIPFFGRGLEAFLEPAVPFLVQIMGLILKVLGIPATIVGPNTFKLEPLNSSSAISLSVIPACIGIYSFLTFSILVIVTLIEDPSSLRTKLFWSVGGIIGTFFVNIIRVSLIFAVIYYFGYENWTEIHKQIGYVLFLVWLGCFFLVFSKRQAIKSAVQSLWQKIRRIGAVNPSLS